MKAKVIRAYTDKNTQKIYLIGDTVELKAERAKELADAGFVEIKAEPKAEPKKKD